jgi:Heterokaryon incompatibility protein (HET)
MTWLTLCRFDDGGILARHEINISKSEYITISHIWRHASWHRIPTIRWKFLASPQKARWISEELPKLVKNCYFWMDILAIDQENINERLAVVDHIPLLYKMSQRTIVVKEQGGFENCCLGYVPDYQNEIESSVFLAQQGRIRHWKESHPNGIKEIWFDRIWPLQEVMLSNKLQFTVCQLNGLATVSCPNIPPRVAQQQLDYTSAQEPKALNLGSLYRLFDTLHSVAEAWMAYGLRVGGEEGSMETYEARHASFIGVMLNNSEIARNSENRADCHYRLYNLLEDESKSQRKTSEARDFILAIFPKWTWYKKPEKVSSRPFGEIFLDAFRQWENNANRKDDQSPTPAPDEDVVFYPRIPCGLLKFRTIGAEASCKGSVEIPEPLWLGDFTKLFCISKPTTKPPLHAPGLAWSMERITGASSVDDILSAIGHSIWFGKSVYWTDFLNHYPEWLVDRSALDECVHQTNALRNGVQCIECWLNLTKKRCEPFPDIEVAVTIRAIYGLYLSARNYFYSVASGGVLESQEPGDVTDRQSEWFAYGQSEWLGYARPELLTHEGSKWWTYRESEWWVGPRKLMERCNSQSFRDSLLLTAAVIGCGLGVSALEWAKDRFQVFLLTLNDNEKMTTKMPARKTLALASKDFEIRPSDCINAYDTDHETWITIRAPEDEPKPRVIGIAPQPTRFKVRGLNLGLFEGIPLAMRTIDEIAHVIMKNPAQLSMEKCEVVVRHSKLAVSVAGNVETSAGGI